MSFIVAVASEEIPCGISWTQFHFGNRLVPAEVARPLLPQLRRWTDHVRPIFSNGDLVGLWVSNLMTTRKWNRLRALAEHLLVPTGSVAQTSETTGASDAEVLTLSLIKHGLWIPCSNIARARATLASLGDIDIECEDEWGHGVELRIRRGASLASVYLALEIDVDTIEPASPQQKREYLNSLHAEIRKLDATIRAAH
jgi:hypothetical protein